jgi:hypothetical protein
VDVLGKARLMAVSGLRHEERWPGFVPKALQLGLGSQMAIKLTIDDAGTLGGLNMYSMLSDAIDPEAALIAELFASRRPSRWAVPARSFTSTRHFRPSR